MRKDRRAEATRAVSNLIKLMTPGRQDHLSRHRIALGDPVLIFGCNAIASLTFRKEEQQVVVYHMALGVPETRLVILPGNDLIVPIEGNSLLLIVRAISTTHIIVDAGKDQNANIAMVLASA